MFKLFQEKTFESKSIFFHWREIFIFVVFKITRILSLYKYCWVSMHKYCITLLDFHLASEAEARPFCIGISERI